MNGSDALSCSLNYPSVAGRGAYTQSFEQQEGDVVQVVECEHARPVCVRVNDGRYQFPAESFIICGQG